MIMFHVFSESLCRELGHDITDDLSDDDLANVLRTPLLPNGFDADDIGPSLSGDSLTKTTGKTTIQHYIINYGNYVRLVDWMTGGYVISALLRYCGALVVTKY